MFWAHLRWARLNYDIWWVRYSKCIFDLGHFFSLFFSFFFFFFWFKKFSTYDGFIGRNPIVSRGKTVFISSKFLHHGRPGDVHTASFPHQDLWLPSLFCSPLPPLPFTLGSCHPYSRAPDPSCSITQNNWASHYHPPPHQSGPGTMLLGPRYPMCC